MVGGVSLVYAVYLLLPLPLPIALLPTGSVGQSWPDSQALEGLAGGRRSGVGGQVAGQLFDAEAGHVAVTGRANQNWRPSA